MDKARGYNHDRLDGLVSRYRKLIRILCWRNAGGDEYACDDLVQECYLSLWLHLVSLRDNATALEETAWVVWQCRSVFSHKRRQWRIDTIPFDERQADYLPAPDY